MNLTKEKLKLLFEKDYEKDNEIKARFEAVDELFEKINENKVEIEGNVVKINGKELKRKDGKDFTISNFGPAIDRLTKGEAYSGVEAISETFDKDYKYFIIAIGKLLGGFDLNTNKMKNKYRIISNSITSNDDYSGSLLSNGQSRHPSSHFADNNYFFNIMYFIQNQDFDKATMVLRYPGKYFKVDKDDASSSKEYEQQKKILRYRFPPKFLWVWANKNEILHPISLMAFRNFLNSEYGKEILTSIQKKVEFLKNTSEDDLPKKVTNSSFDEFKDIWKAVTDKILNDLDITGDKNINKLSLLISQICIEETDIKNISDLLTTGNQAVILWGPPGTGKTYESMQVVKEVLEIGEENIEEKYLFSKNEDNLSKNDKGYYEIIQFHPNYSYQDFIGGIAPMISKSSESSESSISYELREGIFKRFCDKAKDHESKKFIFIIDEINRAELSAVFGELLFSLEYRGKPINLPYFGDFTIPKNVYIIGTMNNVDKSLVTFDLALRRRFGFFKLMPKLEVIKDVLGDIIEKESLERYFKKCDQLNRNIIDQLELEADYQIGQAYFLKIKDFIQDSKKIITSFELEKLWIYHIEPLLEEYLGMAMEDDAIQNKLKKIKEKFLQD
jgi:5-methylcytosine-specific restriction protein B